MNCEPNEIPIQGPVNPVDLPIPPQVATQLITDPTAYLAPLREGMTDTHLAVTRGLAEYLSTLSIVGTGGRSLRFLKSYDEWQEPEQRAIYPSVAVYAQDRGKHEDSSLTPVIAHDFGGDGPARQALVKRGEFVQSLYVDVWTDDPEERTGLLQMCEQGLSPVLWMYGFRLWLPHYYGQIATYSFLEHGYVEEEAAQLRRERRAVLIVEVRVSDVSLWTLPVGRPSVVVSASTDPLPELTEQFQWRQ